jgi:SAM-dependent methyltransferase
MITDKEKVKEYYEKHLPFYDTTYNELDDLYPSNRYRMDLTLDKLMEAKAHRVLDAGCGNGIILQDLLERGFDAEGFDYSPKGVQFAQDRLREKGFDPTRVREGDIETTCGYAPLSFDAIIVMGALTHKLDEHKTLDSLRILLRPGGLLLVELRNELFSLFTFNNYTAEFLQKLMPDSPLKAFALEDLQKSLYFRMKAPRTTKAVDIAEDFFDLPTVWKNPLTIDSEYAARGLTVTDKLFFHWHCVPPRYEPMGRKAFKSSSAVLERCPHDWRGYFMCSAFILVAVK